MIRSTTSPAADSLRRQGRAQYREILFRGIACCEIARVRVTGGDGGVMGDLGRFSSEPGRCLAGVRGGPGDPLRFEKLRGTTRRPLAPASIYAQCLTLAS